MQIVSVDQLRHLKPDAVVVAVHLFVPVQVVTLGLRDLRKPDHDAGPAVRSEGLSTGIWVVAMCFLTIPVALHKRTLLVPFHVIGVLRLGKGVVFVKGAYWIAILVPTCAEWCDRSARIWVCDPYVCIRDKSLQLTILAIDH